MSLEPTTPDSPAFTSADANNERSLNRIPATKVVEVTERLPDEQRLALRWLHAHYWDSGESLAEIARAVGYDGGTLSKVFHGKYEGDLAAVTQAVLRFRRVTEERASIHRAPFIETKLYREIEQCCDAALTYQKLVFIYGESQVGKTASLEHYQQTHNHGQTIMVTMPPGGALSNFLAALAPKVRVGTNNRPTQMMQTITRALGPHNCLLVDEAARAFLNRTETGGLKTLDFIRELHDVSKCGVVLCGTNIFREGMESMALRKFLNQFNRRCLFRKQLPNVPTRADLNAFARHYGLDPAEGEAQRVQRAVVGEHGLGVWLTTLMAASRKAANTKRTMNWSDVMKAHAFFAKLEQTPEEEAA